MTDVMKIVKILRVATAKKKHATHINTNDDADDGDENDWFIIDISDVYSPPHNQPQFDAILEYSMNFSFVLSYDFCIVVVVGIEVAC